MNILIVDDEPGIRFLTKAMLEKEGHSVMEAEDGEDGLAKIKEKKPDLVLLDVMMPGKFGWEVCREIKRNEATKDILVAIFTVRGSNEDMKKSYEVGADAHISKPFTKAELIRTIYKIQGKSAS
jgi:DNA-binding response OmpR family regulator